tara:strand:+ start:2006 stop:2257 length:252 start_codon:yes stop_codon:yes gene_type:complete
MFNNREYLIIPTTEVSKVDLTQVCEISSDTLRFSILSDKTFVKWDGETPAFVSDIVGAEGPYTHTEILEILSSSEWTALMEEV